MIRGDDIIYFHCLSLVRSGHAKRGRIWGVMLGTAWGGYLLRDNLTKRDARWEMRDIAKKLIANGEVLGRQGREMRDAITKGAADDK